MTKLEEEFAKSFLNKGGSAKEMRAINAKVAADIAKKYIEQYKQNLENKIILHQNKYLTVVDDGYCINEEYAVEFSEWEDMWDLVNDHHEQWLKENGIE